ncbi:hypothetical protein K466DRAFT_148126 [Polyporus arcularius HHB13444]|uniref:Uncharacterized protein n=1 Tax=Polyporus arcularius HHB13444 TaxID=1314778 RepID=A0A5C3PD94_9APHY|nr:hypothetical protein K466DRAFT_148126 [Polyporus arcularius HHB13444]
MTASIQVHRLDVCCRSIPGLVPQQKPNHHRFDPSLLSIPPPPIPEELQDRGKILYGCKITDADIGRYLEEERITNVLEDADSRKRLKFALIRSVDAKLDMSFMTQYHKALPWLPKHGPVEDMVYWGYALASYGISYYRPRMW